MSQPPVGKNWSDFHSKWYIASKFGVFRKTYYHNGIDLNLETGGDTDYGETYRSVLRGRLEYYHNASHINRNYGRHNVYVVDLPTGKRWVHGAHLSVALVLAQDIKEGHELGKVGKSGTRFVHLHLSVFKVDPVTLPQGIDTIAKTKKQLDDWWEDPEIFLKRVELLDEGKPMPEDSTRLSRDHYWDVLKELAGLLGVELEEEGDVDYLPIILKKLIEREENNTQKLSDTVEKVIEELDLVSGVSDEVILEAIKKLIDGRFSGGDETGKDDKSLPTHFHGKEIISVCIKP